ncbi:membrane protein insertion efficiency factor YidD [Mollicutes bacterium LVI A0078]|nr:membrane protein insertion efficiency factor YidD [Mollicutes bacterium LVI A0075]WOO90636.1 membrane protein insertion efficiency factor YidD [Mollicutes bacterium LVI A0078]
MKCINKLFSKLFLALIWFYSNAISPHTPRSCRYEPSCSIYTKQAIIKYGPFKGGYKGLKRVLSCHPWGGSGYDPLD